MVVLTQDSVGSWYHERVCGQLDLNVQKASDSVVMTSVPDWSN